MGDLLTIKGVVRESYGVTEIEECSFEKTGMGTLPAAIELSTDALQGCSASCIRKR